MKLDGIVCNFLDEILPSLLRKRSYLLPRSIPISLHQSFDSSENEKLYKLDIFCVKIYIYIFIYPSIHIG